MRRNRDLDPSNDSPHRAHTDSFSIPDDNTISFSFEMNLPAPTARYDPDAGSVEDKPIAVDRLPNPIEEPALELSREDAVKLRDSLDSAIEDFDDDQSDRRNYGSLHANETLNGDASDDWEKDASDDGLPGPALTLEQAPTGEQPVTDGADDPGEGEGQSPNRPDPSVEAADGEVLVTLPAVIGDSPPLFKGAITPGQARRLIDDLRDAVWHVADAPDRERHTSDSAPFASAEPDGVHVTLPAPARAPEDAFVGSITPSEARSLTVGLRSAAAEIDNRSFYAGGWSNAHALRELAQLPTPESMQFDGQTPGSTGEE